MTKTIFKLDDDLEDKLDTIARNLQRSKGSIINDALRVYIACEETKQKMRWETEKDLADLEISHIVSSEEVMKWLETRATNCEAKASK